MNDGIGICIFNAAADILPKYHKFSDWSSFATWITQPHQIRAWKDGPGWSAAVFTQCANCPHTSKKGVVGPPGPRDDQHVTQVNLAVLDFDRMTAEGVEAIETRLQPFAHALYTTFRHTSPDYGGLFAFRVVLPVTRPILPGEYVNFYLKLIDVFGGLADRQDQNPSRFFYLPACAKEHEEACFSYWQDGHVLDVSAVLGRPDIAPDRKPGFGGIVSRELFTEWAKGLRKKADPNSKAIGHALQVGLEGKAFAPNHDRDNALFAMSCAIAEAFPDADSAVIAEWFSLALLEMQVNGEGPTPELFAEKISRKQREVRIQRNQPADDRSRRILNLYRTGRDYGYTAEELGQWGDLSHKWILTRGNDLWFFVHGEYLHLPAGPYTETAALDYLSPATGIQLIRPGKEGFQMLPIRELCMQHGTALREVRASLLVQQTIYDADKHALIEATAPRADVGPPTYDARIDAWLNALLGAPGLDWLAVVTKLEEAAPCLFLSGNAGVGKTLLANGLARLWKAGRPSSIEDVLGTPFNDALSRCPLVFGDENIPKDQGRPKIEELKRLITNTRHRLARKFRDTTDLEGAARIIIAANDPAVVFGRSALTQEDIAALMDRFVYITPSSDARRILEDTPKSMLFQWAEGGGIARHALWLAQNRTVDSTGRLACPASLGEMKDKLMIATGLRWEILDWVSNYMRNPKLVTPEALRMKGLSKPVHLTRDTQTVWIRGESIHAYWANYHDAGRTPEKRKILDEIAHMCPTRATYHYAVYRALDLSLLETWCMKADRASVDLEGFKQYQKVTFG